MPKGYWIAHVDVRDPEIYKQYVAANAVAFAKFGGRFLVRGGKHMSPAGQATTRQVVIEFPDYATALACHDLPGIPSGRETARRGARRRPRHRRRLRRPAAGLSRSGNGWPR